MMGLVDRALALNPSFARGWTISGLLRLFAGQSERAIEHAETALRLSPRARVGTTHGIIGTAHLVSLRFDEALPKLLLAIQEAPSFPTLIAGSPRATPTWGGSTRRKISSSACAPLPRLWFRPPRSFEIRNNGSYCYLACAWRRAGHHDRYPPPRCDFGC